MEDVQTFITKRPTSPGAEKHMYVTHHVLDHGYIRLVDYMGTLDCLARAARVSYKRSTKQQLRNNPGLLRHLIRENHGSPLEMASMKFHMKLPLFVVAQLVRHRTAKQNHMSARYSVMPEDFYLPAIERICVQSTTNNQGSGEQISEEDAEAILFAMEADAKMSRATYKDNIGKNLTRELARLNLPVSTYTEVYWKNDIRNILGFLSLRQDPHAQYEIRVYADKMAEIVKDWSIEIFTAYVDYMKESRNYSRMDHAVVSGLLAAHPELQDEIYARIAEDKSYSMRERREFVAALGLPPNPAFAPKKKSKK